MNGHRLLNRSESVALSPFGYLIEFTSILGRHDVPRRTIKSSAICTGRPNPEAWIQFAMRRALHLVSAVDLEVYLVSYGEPSGYTQGLAGTFR